MVKERIQKTGETDVVGVPYNFGQPKPGVKNGPGRLRQNGFVKRLQELNAKVNDAGDLTFDDVADDPDVNNVHRPRSLSDANRKIAEAVEKSLRLGRQCLVLGGDHSLAIGTIAGQAGVESNVGVVWVDAHGDINPPELSQSGNAHGMPLAFLAHELRHTIPDDLAKVFDWLKPCIHLKNIVYIGLRDVDDAEKEIMSEHNMMAFWMKDVKALGIEEVVRRAVDRLKDCDSLHISFDVDGVDPEFTPSTGTAVPGGLTLEEGVFVVEELAKTGKLSVMDLTEVNPDVGTIEQQLTTLESTGQIAAGWFTEVRTRRAPRGQ